MGRLSKTLLFWTLLLGACTTGISTPQPLPASVDSTLTPFQPAGIIPTIETPLNVPTDEFGSYTPIVTTESPPIDSVISATISVTPDASSINPCGYQWAYEDMPELTTQFDQAVKNLIPNSESHATAFGENCIRNDGSVIRFLAMETDFYVIITDESNSYETYGNWIAQVMQIVNGLPPDLLAGPKSGFVEFRIGKSLMESIGFRVPIQQYNESATDKTGEELLRMFYTVP